MRLPAELAWLERPLARARYRPTAPGLLRIALFTVLWLVVIGMLLPQVEVFVPTPSGLTDPAVIPMCAEREDPRWVRSDLTDLRAHGGPGATAWISGSSIRLKSRNAAGVGRKDVAFLPERVRQILDQERPAATRTYLYYQSRRRLLDTYTLVEDALGRNPGALVVVLNPFWVANGQSVFSLESLFSGGARLWWNRDDWPLQLALVPPRSHLWNFAGRHLPVLSSGYDLRRRFDPAPEDAAEPSEPAARNPISYRQPLTFWALHRFHGGDRSRVLRRGRLDPEAFQAAAMELSELKIGSWQEEIVRRLLRRIQDSSVPAVVYLAPVSPTLGELPGAAAAHSRIVAAVEALKAEFGSETLRITARFPQEVLESLEFRDLLHLSDDGQLSRFLADELSELGEKP